MDLTGAASAYHRAARNTGVRTALRRINVLERQWVLAQVRRVWIAPDPKIVILLEARTELVTHIRTQGVIAVRVVARFAQQRQRIEIRPALAHAARLQRADS